MRTLNLAVTAVLTGMLAAACAAPPTPTPPTPVPPPIAAPVTFNVEATDFKFDKTALEVNIGQKVILNLSNKSTSRPHSLYIHGYDALNKTISAQVAPGTNYTVELTFDKAGYYPFYCPVGAHENAGMGGALTVKGPSAGATSISIQAPAADGIVRGNPATVMVGVLVTGFTLDKANLGSATNKAGTGHWHVLLDGQYAAASADLYASLKDVPIGTHTLKAELHNNDHSPVSPAVENSITFKVEAPPPPTPTPAAR